MASPVDSAEPICDDPDDDKFFLCAISAPCKVIVSGDRHLLVKSGYGGVKVMKPLFHGHSVPCFKSFRKKPHISAGAGKPARDFVNLLTQSAYSEHCTATGRWNFHLPVTFWRSDCRWFSDFPQNRIGALP
jgi:hypothetical protein